MTKESAERIAAYLEDDNTEFTLQLDYSGRGMHGRTTYGITVEDSDDVVFAMGALGIEESRRKDSMGMSVVVY